MATLYITEFAREGVIRGGQNVQAAEVPPLAEQTVPIAGASAPSSALNAKTRLVRLESDVVCSVAFGTVPVATTASMRLAADSPEYFEIAAEAPGTLKVAAISNT